MYVLHGCLWCVCVGCGVCVYVEPRQIPSEISFSEQNFGSCYFCSRVDGALEHGAGPQAATPMHPGMLS